ncbi:MAG: lysylphosphatidylglycerol synthase domain-containing protein, partial [Cytophagales bacterium]
VVVERLMDFLFFFLLLACALFFYFEDLKEMLVIITKQMYQNVQDWVKVLKNKSLLDVLSIVVVCGTVFMMLFLFFKESIKLFFKELFISTKNAIKSTSITFWFITLLTWAFYFLLEYFCFFAFDGTAQALEKHGILPVIGVFIVLQLSHLIPSVGQGAGVYHLFVCHALIYFGISHDVAMAYAVITHGVQLFNGLVPGGMCAIKAFFFSGKKKLKNKFKRSHTRH